MEISYTTAMQTQLSLSARTPSCALRTDRSAQATTGAADLSCVADVARQHHLQNRASVKHTEGTLAFGQFGVMSTVAAIPAKGYALVGDDSGNRLGSPAWSPPV